MATSQDDSKPTEENIYLVKLRRLWKGTLYVCIGVIQVTFIAAAFVWLHWTAGLLVFALIALSLVFRFVASEVDRIGWLLEFEAEKEAVDRAATLWRRTLLILLIIAMHVPSIVLIWYIWTNLGQSYGIYAVVLFLMAEAFYQEIRRINRKVAFRRATYGQHDGSLVFSGAFASNRAPDENAKLERKLSQLEDLADNGTISRRAFEKARDRLWVKHVIESED